MFLSFKKCRKLASLAVVSLSLTVFGFYVKLLCQRNNLTTESQIFVTLQNLVRNEVSIDKGMSSFLSESINKSEENVTSQNVQDVEVKKLPEKNISTEMENQMDVSSTNLKPITTKKSVCSLIKSALGK